MIKKVIILFTVSIIVSCKSAQEVKTKSENVEEISLVTLIANPNKFHKKTVMIQGYFTNEHEGKAIYLSKDDYNNAIRKNAVFLYINKEVLVANDIEPPYKGYVTITGVFNKDLKGSYNFYSGTIEKILKIRRMYKRDGINDEYNME